MKDNDLYEPIEKTDEKAREKYEKPAIIEEHTFETVVLGCGAPPGPCGPVSG